MALKYYTNNKAINNTPKDEFREDIQATIDEQFPYAPNYEVIEEEKQFGTLYFNEIGVRIDHIIASESGQKLGDDYRKLIFQNGESEPINGKRYRFSENIWITMNTKNYKYYTYSSTIVRCNNTLNWLLGNGSIHKEPIAFSNNLSNASFEIKKNVDVQDGIIRGAIQYNEHTKDIKINDRFIIGAGGGTQAWEINSVNTIAFQETFANQPQYMILEFKLDTIRAGVDDLVNRIADASELVYEIDIDQNNVENIVGFNTLLTATTKFNNEIKDDIAVEWTSSDELIATVDKNTGELDLIQIGNATITAIIQGNDSVSDSINIDVVSTIVVDSEPIISPNLTQLLQGQSQEYSVYLYDESNIQLGDTFSIVASDVPTENYDLNIIDGNNFIVTNLKKYSTNELKILCTSGLKVIELYIDLRGAW